MELRLVSNSSSSFLILQKDWITGVHHYAQHRVVILSFHGRLEAKPDTRLILHWFHKSLLQIKQSGGEQGDILGAPGLRILECLRGERKSEQSTVKEQRQQNSTDLPFFLESIPSHQSLCPGLSKSLCPKGSRTRGRENWESHLQPSSVRKVDPTFTSITHGPGNCQTPSSTLLLSLQQPR